MEPDYGQGGGRKEKEPPISIYHDQWGKVGLIKMNDSWTELTLAGEFWQVNLCQALTDYFAVVIEKRPVNN